MIKFETIQRITELELNLRNSDCKVIEYFEGVITQNEYNTIKTRRQLWRNELNLLKEQLKSYG